jgi:hypothetical protein
LKEADARRKERFDRDMQENVLRTGQKHSKKDYKMLDTVKIGDLMDMANIPIKKRAYVDKTV